MTDWLWLGSVLLWGWWGFLTGEQYQKHDMFGFWFGICIWIVFPLGIAAKRLLDEHLWHKKWEREYGNGRSWKESEAAQIRRKIGE
jgi:hypothetical protein